MASPLSTLVCLYDKSVNFRVMSSLNQHLFASFTNFYSSIPSRCFSMRLPDLSWESWRRQETPIAFLSHVPCLCGGYEERKRRKVTNKQTKIKQDSKQFPHDQCGRQPELSTPFSSCLCCSLMAGSHSSSQEQASRALGGSGQPTGPGQLFILCLPSGGGERGRGCPMGAALPTGWSRSCEDRERATASRIPWASRVFVLFKLFGMLFSA